MLFIYLKNNHFWVEGQLFLPGDRKDMNSVTVKLDFFCDLNT